MSTAQTTWDAGTNAEAIQAWDGPLYDRFVRFREIVTTGLGAHGEVALRLVPPRAGQRVLDIGCGFGDTTQPIARLVGPDGASPVAALRNVRDALVPGGRLVMVVWRRRIDNDWLYRGQTIVEAIVSRPDEYDEPTCGPGPFSMADADTTTEILVQAGFTDISLHRCDIPILIGRDVEEAIALLMAMGPSGEILRLAGERAAHLQSDVHAALREGLAEFVDPDGVRAPASTWIVTASRE